MERSSAFTSTEVVAVATAAASALGGILVGLSRAQATAARERLLAAQAAERPRAGRIDVPVVRARQAVESLSATYPGMVHSASELASRLSESARPQVGRVSETASSRLAAMKTSGLSARERLESSIAPAAADAIELLRHRVDEVAQKTQQVAPAVAATTSATTEVAVSRTASAAKDTLATLGWLGAAMAIIYFGLLSRERREQLLEVFAASVEQGRLLIQDFQGYEDEL